MITMRLDTRGADRRLKRLLRDINAWSGQHAEVAPTRVMYEISSIRKQKLLAVATDGHANETRRRVADKGRALLEQYARGRTVSADRVARFWRYVAYVYVERTAWPSARDGAWGRVAATTLARKGRELGEARAFAAEARAYRRGEGASYVSTRRRGRPPTRKRQAALSAYGVRAPEVARRWYRIQIGKRSVGLRDDRAEHRNPVSVRRTQT